MWMQHSILSFAWIIYCLLHSILASVSMKEYMQRRLRNYFRFYRISYTIFSFIGLILILTYQFSMQSLLIFRTGWVIQLIGFVVTAIGASIMIMMIRKYFMQLSGVRWLARENLSSKLEVEGLHRYVRHPLYLGTFIFIWGLFILHPFLSLLIADFIITIYTLIGLRLEERKLIREFGNVYIAYRKKVPMLIPKI